MKVCAFLRTTSWRKKEREIKTKKKKKTHILQIPLLPLSILLSTLTSPTPTTSATTLLPLTPKPITATFRTYTYSLCAHPPFSRRIKSLPQNICTDARPSPVAGQPDGFYSFKIHLSGPVPTNTTCTLYVYTRSDCGPDLFPQEYELDENALDVCENVSFGPKVPGQGVEVVCREAA